MSGVAATILWPRGNKPQWKYGKNCWVSQLSAKLLTSHNARSYMFSLFMSLLVGDSVTKGILMDTGPPKRMGQSQLGNSSEYWGRTCPTCLPWEQHIKCGEWTVPAGVGSRTGNSGESHKVKKMFQEEILRIEVFIYHTTGFLEVSQSV